MAQVSLKNVSKIYNKGLQNEVQALKNISLDIEEGEFVVILGMSGAGKSTLLNILGGMDSLTSGTFIVHDRVISDLKENELSKYRKDDVGFVFQFYNLMPNLTAYENVMLAESISPKPLDSREMLEAVGLSGRENNFPSQLSGGEQQRVSIARAAVKNPTLLLCDEPTGALDSKTGASVLKLLLRLNKQFKKTVLIVTHNAKIAKIAKRVIRVQDGEVVEDFKNEKVTNVENIVW